MPSGSYARQRFASHNPAHPSTWVRVCVLYLEPLWRSKSLRLSEPAFGLPAASRVQQQRHRTPTPAQGWLRSVGQIKPNALFRSSAPAEVPKIPQDATSSSRHPGPGLAPLDHPGRCSCTPRGLNLRSTAMPAEEEGFHVLAWVGDYFQIPTVGIAVDPTLNPIDS